MSQHDLTIDNQGFPAFRADLNNALQALGSTQSGTSAPSPTFANQLWYDTTNNQLKIRNEDNDAWITLLTLDQSADSVSQLATAIAVLSAGTAGAPALTTSGDTNTGIFFPAADTIAFAEGGAEAMRIDSNGNVGIATTSPLTSAKVTVAAGIASNGGISSDLVSAISLDYTSGEGRVIAQGSSGNSAPITFRNGNSGSGTTERMRISSVGNVGVGTSSPATKFQVDGGSIRNVNSNGILEMANGNTAGGTKLSSYNAALTDNGYLAFEGYSIEYARFNASGVLELTQGKIKFPATQSASSDANTLDDYEEGTWTPAFGYSGGNGTMSATYANQFGYYTKVGNLVYVRCDLRFTSFSKGTASGSPWIVGLPFTPQNNGGYGSAIFAINPYQWTFSSTPIGSVRQDGTPAIQLARLVSNSINANLDDPDGDAMLFFSGVYQV